MDSNQEASARRESGANRRPFLHRGIAWALTFAVGLGFGTVLGWRQHAASPIERKLDAMRACIEDESLYVATPEEEEEGLYDGFVGALRDPYSEYIPAAEQAAFLESIQGSMVGIGAYIRKGRDGDLVFVRLFKDGPAEKAGVRAGDHLLAVDGVVVQGLELSAVIADHIQGDADTVVTLRILRPETGEELEISIRRAQVTVQSVEHRLLPDGTGYLRVYEFVENTGMEFIQAVDQLQEQGARQLVIDLRSNPGGVLDAAVQMADYLLPDDLVLHARCFDKTSMVYTVNKYGDSESFFSSDKHQVDLPIAILLNENSASASELFSAALRDNGRALLVGTGSYGKGIVQNTFELDDGSLIKLTVREYFTPSGFLIQDKGLTPDVEVERDEPMDWETGGMNTNTIDELTADNQMRAALEALAAGMACPAIAGEQTAITPPEGFMEEAGHVDCGAAHFPLTLQQLQQSLPALVSEHSYRLFSQSDVWYTGEKQGLKKLPHERNVDHRLAPALLTEPVFSEVEPYFSVGADPVDGRLHWFQASGLSTEGTVGLIQSVLVSAAEPGAEALEHIRAGLTGAQAQKAAGKYAYRGQGYALEAMMDAGSWTVTVNAR